jgi:hypothetical protein
LEGAREKKVEREGEGEEPREEKRKRNGVIVKFADEQLFSKDCIAPVAFR